MASAREGQREGQRRQCQINVAWVRARARARARTHVFLRGYSGGGYAPMRRNIPSNVFCSDSDRREDNPLDFFAHQPTLAPSFDMRFLSFYFKMLVSVSYKYFAYTSNCVYE